MDDEHFSIEHEPALGGGQFQEDPSEARAAPTGRAPDEMETLRDSIAAEPALADHRDPAQFSAWLARKRAGSTLAGDLAVTFLAAVLGGPAAVLGAFMAGQQGTSRLLYVILIGPIIEELLKQSGMIYLVEKKPYRVFATWQFVFAAGVSGAVFATIENLVYIHLYAPLGGVEDVARLAEFRWAVCTPLHVGCSLIASVGLMRAWVRQQAAGRPLELSDAFGWFALAIGVHGLYNFVAAIFVSF